MGHRAPLAVLAVAVAVALVGCAAGDDTTTVTSGDMGTSALHDLAVFHCANIMISSNPPPTLSGTYYAPALLTASVDEAGASGAHWSLQHDNDTPVTPTPIDSGGHRVQYQADLPGTWTFSVSFDVGPCPGTNHVNLVQSMSAQEYYRFRVLPPESLHLPLTDTQIILNGGSNQMTDLMLSGGLTAPGMFKIAGSAAAGEVRFIADPTTGGPDAVAFAGSDGQFTAVLGTGQYAPLVIPQVTGTAIPRAPHLGAQAAGATFVGATFDIPGGVAVSGSFADNAAAPIVGAHMVLRAGALPSGPGLSDPSGAFTLYAEPNTYTMSFGATDWPEGSVGGVVVPAGGTTASVAYTIGRVAIGGSVTGENPAGARVTITSHDPLANVADVVVGGGATVHASGRVARVLFAQADGSLQPFQLPLGTYDVIVEPSGPSLNQGLTAFTEVVSGPATWTLALAKPVTLTVNVTGPDGKAVPGALLTAYETVGLGAAPTGTTGANGQYMFTIDRDAPLSLLVEPNGGDKLAGMRVSVPAGGGTVPVVLGPGLQVSGVVRSPTATPVPGVRVEALCWSCGSTTPVATAISDASGVYRIYLPDPGLVGLDGGVTD
jgi:hypothetical protein